MDRVFSLPWPTALRVRTVIGLVLASASTSLVASPAAVDAEVSRSSGLASRKALDAGGDDPGPDPLLGTLVQTHTDERVALDENVPSDDRFSALLADRATGEDRPLDPRLLGLLRALARRHPGARFDLVSGYRSPKLNEMLRKKGHHVASHSQHSLGHAVDFRLFDPASDAGTDDPKPIDPAALEREIRALGWDGGVGVYLSPGDRFVHADVGPNRRWNGL
jgi:uncharacterized protein YcbK (DUF882 family)